MAATIGFGAPLLFVLLFIVINYKRSTTPKLTLYAILLYVGSVALGIGSSIVLGVGAIFSGVIFPVILLIVLTMVIRS